MSDYHVEVSEQGWFGRIGGAVVGVLVGFLALVIGLVVLFWNEGRAVHRAQDLTQFAAAAVTVDPAAPSPAHDGRPVHFTGEAVGGPLKDPVFAVAADGLRLRRTVEMYQWDEDKRTRKEKKAFGGGERTVTEYRYAAKWSGRLIPSANFNQRSTHENPTAMRVEAGDWTAPAVKVGAFTLPPFLVEDLENKRPVPATDDLLAALPAHLKDGAAVRDGKVYLPRAGGGGTGGGTWASADPSNPQVGDCRVSFELVPNGPVSVIAVQRGTALEKFQADHGEVSQARAGTHALGTMMTQLQSENRVLAWILRGVGWLVLFVGFVLVLWPLRVLADVVSIVGDLVGAGVFLVALVLSVVTAAGTIAVAWVIHRPVLGVGLMAVAVLGSFWLVRLKRRGHDRYAASHGGPVPVTPPYNPAAGYGPGLATAGTGASNLPPPIPGAYHAYPAAAGGDPPPPQVPGYGQPGGVPPIPRGPGTSPGW